MVPLDFTAIDFETANGSSASACSVGLVKVRDGVVVDTASWLIKPPPGHDEFSEWNVRVHGILPRDVTHVPGWGDRFDEFVAFVGGDALAAHNAGFDMGVIRGVCAAAGIRCPSHDYVCSLQVARRTYSLDSYRLPVVAMAAGFDGFHHHEALADAEACAAIVVHAARRHDASSIAELAAVTRVRIGRIGDAPAAV